MGAGPELASARPLASSAAVFKTGTMTLDDLLKKWLGKEGGAERANYQMFLTELTQALGLPAPDPKGAGLGDYQFEAPVRSEAALGTKGTGRIDLYKRDSFILEAKQSQVKPGEALPEEPAEPPPAPIYDLFGNPVGFEQPKAKNAPRYDKLMADARIQAERYALALPDDHRTPPFLIVADIGRSFELYFDWSGNGRGYGPFPDERGYRIRLDDLAGADKIKGLDLTPAELLRAIWTDPASVDPRLKAAEVTRDIAERLSRVAAALEQTQRQLAPGDAMVSLRIEATSLFLMRMLFCMFAEDVELLPKDSFKRFLQDSEERSDLFWRSGLNELWSKMNDPQEVNRFWSHGDAVVRYFNGNLFSGVQVFDLPGEFKRALTVAAGKDWRKVEPAIFGTLLEQVLTVADRARFGAHYTPRPYVERLVDAVMMEVLRPEWEAALSEARAQVEAGDSRAAIAAACAFHARLVAIEVLDPACGTGNFLYVAMEQLLRLESEVRQFVIGLGGTLDPAVHPNQFLGLELNPRAAVIAELVLWIGWLRYRLANTPEAIGNPVLPPLTNINFGTHGGYDAVVARTDTGQPDTDNPRRPAWPEADFIVGNPPFIGGKDIRERLGGEYAETLWKANPGVPKSADFVMQWWDRAADILTREGSRLRRFGFVTTNSITQVFSRKVIERHLSPSSPAGEGLGRGDVAARKAPADTPSPSAPDGAPPSTARGEGQKLHLTLAIPDHPWTRASKDAAAVRIAMTAAQAGPGAGRLVRIVREAGLDTDAPELEEEVHYGVLHSNLRLQAFGSAVQRLRSNPPFRVRGIEFHGQGYVLDQPTKESWSSEAPEFYGRFAKPYVALNDYKVGRQNRFVLDLYGLKEKELRQSAPKLYDHLLKTAFPSRKDNDVPFRRDNWWMLALPHVELRQGLAAIDHVVLTPITSKHRWFVRDVSESLPDQSLLAIFLPSWTHLGVLSSRIHEEWFYEHCGWLGVGNDSRYNPTRVFDTYPFPNLSDESVISALAEELHATRKIALADNPSLTMTGLYNLVEEVRGGALDAAREQLAVKARARIVAKLHDDLDAAVAAAYGWEWPLAPAEIVARLVALNAERAAEEKAGKVRWLRPDYQEPRFARPAAS
jgi:hypothetical protein